jgi:pimeloyl-ACP methyl ester carboxylesterase
MRYLLLCVAWLLTAIPVCATDGQFLSKGVRICYSDVGNPNGEPVILIHGYVVTGTLQWTLPGITKALSKDYRVVLFDNRGHGRSERPHAASQYGMEMVSDVLRLMDHLNIEKAHLVGYSMGAFIAHKLAATHPERVKSLILGGAGWLQEGPATQAMDEIAESLTQKKSLEPLFRSLHPSGSAPLAQAEVQRINAMAMLINDPLALAAVAHGMKQLVLKEDEAKRIKVPTFCIVGDCDPLCETVKRLALVRPDVRTYYVKGGNHMNTYNLPIFREQIEKFLAQQAK